MRGQLEGHRNLMVGMDKEGQVKYGAGGLPGKQLRGGWGARGSLPIADFLLQCL